MKLYAFALMTSRCHLAGIRYKTQRTMGFFAITAGDADVCAQQWHNEERRNWQVLACKSNIQEYHNYLK